MKRESLRVTAKVSSFVDMSTKLPWLEVITAVNSDHETAEVGSHTFQNCCIYVLFPSVIV